jgi:hypothetical protein
MIDAATDAQAAGLARPAERLRQAPHLNLAQHSHEPLATSNRPACLHVRGNGLGDMKMLKLKPDTLGIWNQKNFGPPQLRIGKRYFYCIDSVHKWFESLAATHDLNLDIEKFEELLPSEGKQTKVMDPTNTKSGIIIK